MGIKCTFAHGLDKLGDSYTEETAREAKRRIEMGTIGRREDGDGDGGEQPPVEQHEIDELWRRSIKWKYDLFEILGWTHTEETELPPVIGHPVPRPKPKLIKPPPQQRSSKIPKEVSQDEFIRDAVAGLKKSVLQDVDELTICEEEMDNMADEMLNDGYRFLEDKIELSFT